MSSKSLNYWRSILLIFWIAILCACTSKEIPKNLDEIRRKEPTSESFNIVYAYSDSGHITAKLKAPHDLEITDRNNQETFHNLDKGFLLETYNTDGKLEATVRANEGRLFQKRGYAEAIGNVVLTSAKGEVMETEKLFWYRLENKITTQEDVKIRTNEEVIYGKGFESNTNFTKYKIFKIRGTMNVKE